MTSLDTTDPLPPSGELPSPAGAESLDQLVERLGELREWAGQPSYAEIAERVRHDRAARGIPEGAQRLSRSTVFDLFRTGRNRLDVGLLVEVVRALGVDATGAAAWRHAYGRAAGGAPEVRRLIAVAASIPPPGPGFTGRDSLVDRIVTGGAGTTTVLVGMAGVGKSQIALRAADRLRPAGAELFVPLGGGDRRQLPVEPAALLRDLLVFVGVTPRRLSALSTAEQHELWARWIGEHAAVVVLDDAFDAHQIEAVVPPAHGGRIVVTSRAELDLPGVATVPVPPLHPDEAVAFLQTTIGTDHAPDPDGLGRIAELCGGIPLELSVAAARIAEQPTWTIDDHLRRFARLPVGRTLSAALSATTDALDDDQHTVFRRLALHPGSRVATWSTAALCDRDEAAVGAALDGLAALSLVTRSDADGWPAYRLHDLVREHAAELLHDHDAYTAQAQAVARLCAEATRLVDVAAGTVLPVTADDPNAGRRLDGLAATLTDDDTARAWFAAERLTLVDLIDLAVTFDLHAAAGDLFLPVVRYLDISGEWELAVKTAQQGVLTNPDPSVCARAWRSIALVLIRQARYSEAVGVLERARGIPLADPNAVEQTHTLLGGVYAGLGRLHDALAEHRRAAELAAEGGDPIRVGRTQGNLANRLRELGELDVAERLFRERIVADAAFDDPIGVAMGLGNLALLLEEQRHDDEALDLLERALAAAAEAGSRIMDPLGLIVIGRIHGRRGDRAAWLDHTRRGMALAEEIGADAEVGGGHCELGDMALLDGDAAAAAEHYAAALAIASEGNDHKAIVNAINLLGAAATAAGDLEAATAHHRRVLALCESSGYKIEIAHAHAGLARVAAAAGEPATAAEHQATASRLFTEMGVPYDP